jgi:hypothetical protein
MSPILGARGGLSASAYGFTSAVAALGDYESIATVTVGGGGSSTITFSSIPSTYSHLQVRGIARSSFTGGGDAVIVRLNGDSGANYIRHVLLGDGSSATAAASSPSSTFGGLGAISSDQSSASIFGAVVFDLLDYTNTNKNRTMRSLSGYDVNGSGSVEFRSNLYTSTTAVSSITLTLSSDNFKQYSSFALYGIK